MSFLSGIFSNPKSLFVTIVVIGLLGYSTYISYTLYRVTSKSAELQIEYNDLKSKYQLSEEANKILKETNEDNITRTNATIEAMKAQIEEERKLQFNLIDRYKQKIAILSNSKDVPESETTGVADQDTSAAFVNRLNSVIEEYNNKRR